MFVTFKALGHVGRLGNQLFQIAATVGIARRNGFGYVFPPWPPARYFAGPIPQSDLIPPTRIHRPAAFAYQDVPLAGPTNLFGLFQSERYFKHCQQEIREMLAPRREFSVRLHRIFGDLRNHKTCSVHVRRTDYIGDPNFSDLTATNYYEQAFRHFDDETTFVVFSDDPGWCRQRFQGTRYVFIEGHPPIVDLFLMSMCNAHIIANSTFSWWGAWFDPKEAKTVIAPKRWFGPAWSDPAIPYRFGPQCSGYHDTKDLIPPGWIRL